MGSGTSASRSAELEARPRMTAREGRYDLPEAISSPVACEKRALLIKTIDLRAIGRQYRRRYGVDIHAHLQSPVPEMAGLYRCSATGYEFFHPPRLAGLPTFYEELQRFPWYYVPWKWEHEIAKSYLTEGDRVLEVGCGVGFFLKRVSEEMKVECTGLEFNAKARSAGVFRNILGDSVQVYAEHNPEGVDVVCTFQVLEHVYDVAAFLKACCAALVPGGRLVLSVPNNDSNIQYDKRNVLNMPPHHMGLWRAGSLASLTNHFPLILDGIFTEPLTDSSLPWHTTLRHAKSIGYLPALALAKLRYFGARKWFDSGTARLREITPDHTIACVYRKTG
jgi:2-polyprenyl-3-methyl-5-hydroxy-6-metoxy-1,4-benzoquinol methylase